MSDSSLTLNLKHATLVLSRDDPHSDSANHRKSGATMTLLNIMREMSIRDSSFLAFIQCKQWGLP